MMLAVFSALAVSAVALPQSATPTRDAVPSMANGLAGTAMSGHRWVQLPADPTLEATFADMGVMNAWTSGLFEAVVAPGQWEKVERFLEGKQWNYHAQDVQEMLETDKEARRRHP